MRGFRVFAFYQERTLAAMLPAAELIGPAEPQLDEGTLMFRGTLAALRTSIALFGESLDW